MILLFSQLLLAHLLGDFVLQPSKWVSEKRRKKHKSSFLYYHLLVHFLLLIICLNFNFNYYWAMLISIGSHYLIDLTKLHFEGKLNAKLLFFADQILHLIVIFGITMSYFTFSLNWDKLITIEVYLLIIGIVTSTAVISVIMPMLLQNFKPESEFDDNPNRAGSYIGMLERIFIFCFIVFQYWEGIGFLIAAKSVLRYGDLSTAKNRKLTEYVLIGTMISFGLAILVGLLYVYILRKLI